MSSSGKRARALGVRAQMPDRIDEFESVFRSADKPLFHLAPPPVRRALVLSDRGPGDADAFEDRVRRYVESGEPDSTLEWQSWHGDVPDTRQAFVERLKAYETDLVVTHRNLHDVIRDPHFGLGVYVCQRRWKNPHSGGLEFPT